MPLILIVEDDDNQRKIMKAYLRSEGFDTLEARDAYQALEFLELRKPDMAICDVMLPGMDGFTLTRELRAFDHEMPILITTALSEMNDKEKGFHAGTDDYMVKPVDLNELGLRVRALFRRSRIQAERRIELDGALINSDDFSVSQDGKKLVLARREFQLLFMLASYPGVILTRRQLMDEVWGVDCDTDERTVDVHVKRLREKLRFIRAFTIETVRGLGYILEAQNA